MKIIKAKRGRAKGSLSRAETFAKTVDSKTPLSLLEIRLQQLEQAWSDFVALQDQLYEYVDDPGFVDPETEFEEYESKYFFCHSTFTSFIKVHRATTPPTESAVEKLADQQASFLQTLNSSRSSTSVDLPAIKIPSFTGNYKDWPSFRDYFTGSVDSKTSLTATQKFHHLKSSVGGDAANLIKHIAVCDNNYIEAWEKLEKRYDRSHLITQAFVQSFLSLPTTTSSNVALLRKISDGADEAIRGLNALGSTDRDPWLIYLLVQKLDLDTKQAWAEHVGSRDDLSINDLLEFLQNRCVCLETCQSTISRSLSSRAKVQGQGVVRAHHTVESKQICPKCKEEHNLSNCKTFRSLSIDARRSFVKEHSLCFNCLRQGHTSIRCKSNFRCKNCKSRHHTLVHLVDASASSSNHVNVDSAPVDNDLSLLSEDLQSPVVNHHSHQNSQRCQTILPTAVAKTLDKQSLFQNVRILLDTGSQVSFITEHAVQRLGLSRTRSRIPVIGVASTSAGVTNGVVKIRLFSRYTSEFVDVSCHVLSKLTSLLPPVKIEFLDISDLLSVELADPKFYEPSSVDILIGADKVFSLITGPSSSTINKGIPSLIPTIFGTVVTGRLESFSSEPAENINSFCTRLDHACEFDLEKFWRLEEIANEPVLSIEEQKAEEIFARTHSRSLDGRYIVQLPFKSDSKFNFGDSFRVALSRLQSNERRFIGNPSLYNQYRTFLKEYLELGHMEEVPPNEIIQPFNKCYYLPHHAVFKADSSTTKIRVVFDASAKTGSSKSLNECLLVGPTIQKDIFSICLRFRRHAYTISGDVEKMYRQIWVSRDQTNFQRILWRETPESELKHYRLLTVTYGTAPAPFLAVRTLKQLAMDYALSYPKASAVVLNDFYVDDVITGEDSIPEVVALQNELVALLKTGGFNLRKWTTNCWPLLVSLPEDQRELSPIEFEESVSVKVLGLQWCPSKDCFSYRVKLNQPSDKCTKRRILSEASKVFDPLGFVAPVIVVIKILLQDIWRNKMDWDDEIQGEMADRWYGLRQELSHVEGLRIPRSLWLNKYNWELHGFCDASLDAYAAVIYCRSIDSDGNIMVTLVSAKSKVSPLKVQSIPRLELCGALLLTRLTNKLITSFQEKDIKVYAWTDSSIVLHWLSAPPKKWSVFVGNRTSEILSSVPLNCWNHVRSASNPADCASRGISPTLLAANELWWKGPSWLWQKRSKWPISSSDSTEYSKEQLEERKTPKTQVFVSCVKPKNIIELLVENTPNWYKCIRSMSYIIRFTVNARLPSGSRNSNPLSTKELSEAKFRILKCIQSCLFSSEIAALRKGNQLPKKHKLSSLAPFLDSRGILRVSGRVQASELSYNQKHPIILCKSHRVSELIAQYIHRHYLHAGVTMMFALVKQDYYIIGCRNLLRRIVHDCVHCFRQRQTISTQFMGELPAARVRFSRPFSKVGCDYAGPITLRLSRGRNPKFTKAYIALFVCFVTKGIHLELVGDLTSHAFLMALDRFSARRGKPSEIWSDNGTNFCGAKRLLNELYENLLSQQHQNVVINHLAKDNITWNFLPPGAPHFGGLWEAGVKSVKQHLNRVIGDTKLTYEEMYTLLSQIEALLNSRPMWQTPDTEPCALSPSHFMIGESYTATPLPEMQTSNFSPCSNWFLLQTMMQGFWKRWHQEYLTSLQQRKKWTQTQPNLAIDDVVLLREPNLPPSKWLLGRIKQTHPGKDGMVRVVTIQTKHGEYTRPIVKVAPLPITEKPESFRGG